MFPKAAEAAVRWKLEPKTPAAAPDPGTVLSTGLGGPGASVSCPCPEGPLPKRDMHAANARLTFETEIRLTKRNRWFFFGSRLNTEPVGKVKREQCDYKAQSRSRGSLSSLPFPRPDSRTLSSCGSGSWAGGLLGETVHGHPRADSLLPAQATSSGLVCPIPLQRPPPLPPCPPRRGFWALPTQIHLGSQGEDGGSRTEKTRCAQVTGQSVVGAEFRAHSRCRPRFCAAVCGVCVGHAGLVLFVPCPMCL